MNKISNGLKKLNSLDFTKEQIINFLLHVAIILVPLIIFDFRLFGIDSKVSQGHSQFVEGKVYFMMILGVLLLILSIMSLRKINKENIIALIFLSTIFVSAICSPYMNTAFFGNKDRGEGFIIIAVYVLMFILASHYFKPSKLTLRMIFISTIIVNVIALVQFMGFDLISFLLGFEQGGKNSAVGTIGNRNFLGTYSCIFLILSMAIYIFKAKKEYLIYASINFIGLLCSLTRSCWMSFVVVSVIGIIFILKRKDCLKRAGILIITLIAIFASLNFVSDNRIIGRSSIENIVSNDGELVDSAYNRNEIFKLSVRAFCQKPFLGTGPDTLSLRLKDDYTEEYWEYAILRGQTIDKAHNEFLEYAVCDGAFTLIAYIVLIIFVIKKLVKNIKDDVNKILLLVIVGYLVQSILNISTVGVAQIFWIILGYAICRNNKQGLEEK